MLVFSFSQRFLLFPVSISSFESNFRNEAHEQGEEPQIILLLMGEKGGGGVKSIKTPTMNQNHIT